MVFLDVRLVAVVFEASFKLEHLGLDCISEETVRRSALRPMRHQDQSEFTVDERPLCVV